ncbi:MAG TPA: hypothetical protein VLJ11_10990 [Bryobacteraceae bacterium]|nr:hypothetical protein [Bryobacteraceae bacterium]
MTTAAQLAANQANATLSTGPKTEEGKAVSSKNNFRHGLSGRFIVQSWEESEHYDDLLDGLREEHQPATPTEALLVEKMAQHWWLAQRALHLEELTFHTQTPFCDNQKLLALYIRYGATHDRAFHKCLSDLLKLRAEKRRAEKDRDTQERAVREETRKQELNDARVRALNAKSEDQELDTEIRTTIEAPLPGHIRIPFPTLKHVLSQSLQQVAKELQAESPSQQAA